jgi:hypothetical protein
MKGKSHNGLFSIYDHKEQKKGKYVSNENWKLYMYIYFIYRVYIYMCVILAPFIVICFPYWISFRYLLHLFRKGTFLFKRVSTVLMDIGAILILHLSAYPAGIEGTLAWGLMVLFFCIYLNYIDQRIMLFSDF